MKENYLIFTQQFQPYNRSLIWYFHAFSVKFCFYQKILPRSFIFNWKTHLYNRRVEYVCMMFSSNTFFALIELTVSRYLSLHPGRRSAGCQWFQWHILVCSWSPVPSLLTRARPPPLVSPHSWPRSTTHRQVGDNTIQQLCLDETLQYFATQNDSKRWCGDMMSLKYYFSIFFDVPKAF